MDHSIISLVLVYLAESGPTKSGEVAEGLKSLRISRKYASLVLTRCYRRRFVSRRPYKRGRERGYVYQLSDKGAEWLLYKASQKNDDLHDGKPVAEVEERSIDSPRLVVSNSAQVKFEDKDPFNRALIEVARARSLSKSTAPMKHQKTIPDIIFAFLAKERREEAEYLLYLLEQEQEAKERYKRLYEEKNSKCEVLKRELERKKLEKRLEPIRGDWQPRAWREGLKLERQIGKLEAKAEQNISHGKLISSLLQDRLSRKQKDEEMFSARLACHYINNRWWDLLSPGSNRPLPPVRGPARGA